MSGIAAAGATPTMESRALLSGGASHEAIYAAVARLLPGTRVSTLVDVGCGRGALWPYVAGMCDRYVGVDAVAYEGFPAGCRLLCGDLDVSIPLGGAVADAVVSVETIEHLENPRAFVRELVRIAAPGGLVVVTTPNQLSALSLTMLILRQRFAAFQDVHYPAHRTALLEVDLRRIAAEAGLEDVRVAYSLGGRMPFTGRHYPRALARLAPRLLSDTAILIGKRPRSCSR